MKYIKFLIILIPFVLFSCAENLSEKAKKFSQEKIIIDTHIDTPFQIWRQRNNIGTNDDIFKDDFVLPL